MIPRTITSSILQRLNKGKAIIILGPRQSGKTTLLKEFQRLYPNDANYYNCDDAETRALFSSGSISMLRQLFGNMKMLLIDEAQKIENAGLAIKIIVDNLPGVQVIATGSSAFELSDKLNEPLTGRKWEYQLLPLSFEELATHSTPFDEIRLLKLRLMYGTYPDVVNNPGLEQDVLAELCTSYLYKDVFTMNDIRKPELIEKLLNALALQLGSEVSFNELAQLLQTDPATIERYILMLERAFIVFRITNFSTNQRNEIKKSRKIYFYDNGVRNSLLSDFKPVELRTDIGALWENYVVSEFTKKHAYYRVNSRQHFWRSSSSGEVDYIEIQNAQINAFEIKWNPTRKAKVRSFLNLYPDAKVNLVNPHNYFQYLLDIKA